MEWLKLPKKLAKTAESDKHVKTEGLWVKCDSCRQISWRKDLDETLQHLSQVRAPLQHRRADAAEVPVGWAVGRA